MKIILSPAKKMVSDTDSLAPVNVCLLYTSDAADERDRRDIEFYEESVQRGAESSLEM